MGLLSEVLESAAVVEREEERGGDESRSKRDTDARALVAELLEARDAKPPPGWCRRTDALLVELTTDASIESRAELEFAAALARAAELVDGAALAARRRRLSEAAESATAALDALEVPPPSAALATVARAVRSNASARRARVACAAAKRLRERVAFALDANEPSARLDVDSRDASEFYDALGALFACGRVEAELAPLGEWIVSAVELVRARSCRVDVERGRDRLRVAVTQGRGDEPAFVHAIALLDALVSNFDGQTERDVSVASTLRRLCGQKIVGAFEVELEGRTNALARLRELGFDGTVNEPVTRSQRPPSLLQLACRLASTSPRTAVTVEHTVVTSGSVELREAVWASLADLDVTTRLVTLETAKHALELFCNVTLHRVDESGEPSPYDLALCYNDCIYCVRTMLGPPWSKTLPLDYARFVHSQFVASARNVNALAILKLSTVMKTQHAILERIVSNSELNDLEKITSVGSSSDIAIANCLAKLKSLHKHWKPVFAKQLYENIMSEIINSLCRSFVNAVLTIKEKNIGEYISSDLANAYQPVVTIVPTLFDDKTNVEKLCVQFSRLSKLIWILKMPLFSIASAWKRSGDDLSKYFTSDEIKHFIRIIFPSSNQKSTALNMIQ